MATSSILGIDRAQPTRRGHDTQDLGPSDTTDSGSDVAGIEGLDDGDPGMPVDAAIDPDSQRSDTVPDSFADGADSDSRGSGERRSAAGDSGREAADIGPDRIVGDPKTFSDIDDPDDRLPSEGGGSQRDEIDDMDLAAADIEDADEDGIDDAEDDEVSPDAGSAR